MSYWPRPSESNAALWATMRLTGAKVNTGPQVNLDARLHTLKSQVVGLLAGRTQPDSLIGWSQGGLYAREIGKLMAPRTQ